VGGALFPSRGIAADVVLSDVMMPGGMDGVEFAAIARGRFPALPMVLATGQVGALAGRPLPRGVALLRKPLARSAIAAAVRRAITEAREVVGA
jgi:CheY-like chemotaxis protein